MKVVYTNDTINATAIGQIINTNNKNQFVNRKTTLLVPYSNAKICFVKTIDRTKESSIEKELQPTLRVVRFLNNNKQYQPLFVKINAVVQLNNNDHYLMDVIRLGDLKVVLPLLKKKWKYSLLIQALFGLYILNHKIKMYHNDLFFSDVVRNMMVDSVDGKTSVKLAIDNVELTLKVEKFCVKVIDFGRCSSKPAFRVSEYHKKYFPDMKYVSEMFLFTFMYFKTINEHERIDFNALQLDLCNQSSCMLDFDNRFLLNMCERFSKYLN